MNDNIFWLLELSVKAGEMENVKSLMNEMVAATLADEPGALNYEWFVNEADNTVHIYEHYADSDAVMVHLGNFGAKFGGRFMAAMMPTRLTVYGKPSEEATEALAGLGAVFHPPTAGFAR
ncbi:MAG: antibiotic biosynthesis monooxygenase [Chloroflexota bacterium]